MPLLPWGRVSHNWLAKVYFLGAGTFVFFAFHFDNPYLLLGVYPEAIAVDEGAAFEREIDRRRFDSSSSEPTGCCRRTGARGHPNHAAFQRDCSAFGSRRVRSTR
ncbi:MAG: hypothetical protein WAP35_04290 [Solirubrobacterales bacterium]